MCMPRRGEPYRKPNWRIRRFLLFILFLSGRIPPLRQLLLYLWKKYRLLTYKWRSRQLTAEGSKEFDVDKIYWVDPARIVYSSLQEFDIYRDRGRIVGGNWDRLDKKFEELDIYIAFKERYRDGKNWDDTFFYQRVLGEIESGKFLWRCRNKSDLNQRCSTLDSLFQDIKHDGYKLKSEITRKDDNPDPIQSEDEITVNVGRDGDLLFNNGAHRLSIAKILNIQRIPIKITVRHTQWVNFRREIMLFSQDQPCGKIYHPLTHVDLQDIPAVHDLELDRFSMIQANLTVSKGLLLDIGAQWGYFCHKFEEIGFDCYAVEQDSIHIYFLKKLKRVENRRFSIIPKSIFHYNGVENLQFDVVLALNIFHHFLKEEDSYLKLCELLGKLEMKEMYFEAHNPIESQMKGAYKNYSEEEFVEFIVQTSKLKESQLLGRANDGRGIYKLY